MDPGFTQNVYLGGVVTNATTKVAGYWKDGNWNACANSNGDTAGYYCEGKDIFIAE